MNLFSQWIAQLSLDHFTPTPSDIFPSNFLPGPLRFHSPLDIFRSLKGEETPSKIVRHLCPFFLFHVRNVFAMRTECPFLPFARFNFFSLLLDARACVRACVCVCSCMCVCVPKLLTAKFHCLWRPLCLSRSTTR